MIPQVLAVIILGALFAAAFHEWKRARDKTGSWSAASQDLLGDAGDSDNL